MQQSGRYCSEELEPCKIQEHNLPLRDGSTKAVTSPLQEVPCNEEFAFAIAHYDNCVKQGTASSSQGEPSKVTTASNSPWGLQSYFMFDVEAFVSWLEKTSPDVEQCHEQSACPCRSHRLQQLPRNLAPANAAARHVFLSCSVCHLGFIIQGLLQICLFDLPQAPTRASNCAIKSGMPLNPIMYKPTYHFPFGTPLLQYYPYEEVFEQTQGLMRRGASR